MTATIQHPIDERLYSNSETAFRLQISISTLATLRSRREIGFFRIGGAVMFCDHHIADYKSKTERKPDR